MSKEERNEKKEYIEKMSEKFAVESDIECKSMAAMCISAYIEGRTAGIEAARKSWEQQQATA